MSLRQLREALALVFLGESGGLTGAEWDVCIIAMGWSKNIGGSGHRRFYPKGALEEAVKNKVFEGLKACAYRFGKQLGDDSFDHLPNDARKSGKQFAENVVGFYHKVRYGTFVRPNGTKGEGVLAKFRILEGHEWLRKNMRDAWKSGRPDLFGFSIDADGAARIGIVEGRSAEIVEKIIGAESTDVVSEPAAGGSLLRLVASRNGREELMDWQELLRLIEQHRPEWVKGINPKAPEQETADYLTQMLEAALTVAETGFDGSDPSDGERFAEQGKGLQLLRKLLSLVQGDKKDDALGILKSAIAAYPEPAKEGGRVPEATPPTPPAPPAPPEPPAVDDTAAARLLAMETQAQAAISALTEATNAANLRESQALVTNMVNASSLPDQAKAKLIGELTLEGMTAPLIEAAITKETNYLASFKESGSVRGLGGSHDPVNHRVEISSDQRDKIRDAFDGMFAGRNMKDGREDPSGLMFHSLTESWATFSLPFFDRETQGEVMFKAICAALPAKITQKRLSLWDDPWAAHQKKLKESWTSFVPADLREAVTTSDWSVAFGDALFRRLQMEYDQDDLSDWRQIISSTENLQDWTNSVNIIRRGRVGTLPVVAENAPYQELTPVTPSEENEQLTPEKRGGLQKLTMEDVMADRLQVIRQIPRDLAQSANRTIHEKVWDELETNPNIQGNPLIDAANFNRVATDPALAYDPVTDAVRLLRDQTELSSGKRLGLKPKFLIVGTKLENEAIELTDSNAKVTSTDDATTTNVIKRWGIQAFPTLGVGRTATTEDFWWVVADPKRNPTIAVGFPGGRDRPDIFIQGQGQETVGSVFDADAITFKVRLIVGAKVIDFRSFVGSRTP